MSFLKELRKQKNKLKEAETVVTTVDGQRYVEKDSSEVERLDPTYGFVVDTKPDNVPALIVDHLYIGSQDCTAANVLDCYNIKHVLSVGINIDVGEHVCHKYVQCLDLPEASIKIVLSECLPFIDQAVASNENVLVHCNAGVSRTSTVAVAFLMHYRGMEYEDAYKLVKAKRPAIQPNLGFKLQLRTMLPYQVI